MPTTCAPSINSVGGGPVDVFASSGGAVNALALVATDPDLVGTLVAHEPPAASLLPDANEALAACPGDLRDLSTARKGCRHGAVHQRW